MFALEPDRTANKSVAMSMKKRRISTNGPIVQ